MGCGPSKQTNLDLANASRVLKRPHNVLTAKEVKRAVGYFKEMRKPKTPCLDKYDLSDVLPEDRQFLGEDIFFPFLPALGYDAGFVGPRTTLTPEQFCWMLQRFLLANREELVDAMFDVMATPCHGELLIDTDQLCRRYLSFREGRAGKGDAPIRAFFKEFTRMVPERTYEEGEKRRHASHMSLQELHFIDQRTPQVFQGLRYTQELFRKYFFGTKFWIRKRKELQTKLSALPMQAPQKSPEPDLQLETLSSYEAQGEVHVPVLTMPSPTSPTGAKPDFVKREKGHKADKKSSKRRNRAGSKSSVVSPVASSGAGAPAAASPTASAAAALSPLASSLSPSARTTGLRWTSVDLGFSPTASGSPRQAKKKKKKGVRIAPDVTMLGPPSPAAGRGARFGSPVGTKTSWKATQRQDVMTELLDDKGLAKSPL